MNRDPLSFGMPFQEMKIQIELNREKAQSIRAQKKIAQLKEENQKLRKEIEKLKDTQICCSLCKTHDNLVAMEEEDAQIDYMGSGYEYDEWRNFTHTPRY